MVKAYLIMNEFAHPLRVHVGIFNMCGWVCLENHYCSKLWKVQLFILALTKHAIGMKVTRHAGVDSRMIILDDQARQQITLHFQLSLQCNVSPITGFVRHTAMMYAVCLMKPVSIVAVCLSKPVMGETLHWSDNWKCHLLTCLIVQSNHPTKACN